MKQIVRVFQALVYSFFFAGIAFGGGKPGFKKPAETTAAPTAKADADAEAKDKAKFWTTQVPGTTAMSDGFYHTVYGNVVGKGALDIVNLTVDDQGALVYVARMITDDRFHVVHGGVMSADGYFEIGDITVKSNEGLTFDAMNEYHQVVSVWNSIEHRREFGSLAHHITKRGVNYDDPSLQRTPEMPIKPARKCGGFDLSEYIIAQNEPLAVLKSEDGVRICWGNDVTRTFKKVESLAFENGKVSYLAQNSDETWQVVWNGVEGKKFTSIRYYDLVNGNPQYWGQAVDSHFYVVNGASASQPYGEVKLYQYGFGKQLYVARKLDPAAKLNTSSPQRKI